MITYHQGKWALSFAFSLHGSVFPKSFVWGLPSALLASGLHYVFEEYPSIRDSVKAGDVGASILSGFTFILGFLIVFRSQQAYSRWWEGGTLLQQVRGEWFNAFSSLVAFCNPDKAKQAEVKQFQHRLVRLVSLLYAAALEQVTTVHKPHLEVIELDGFELDHFVFMQASHDKCEVVLQWLQRLIVEAHAQEVVKVAPPILGRVYNQLGNGIVNLNNARKITDFPIPFPLAQMVTFMLVVHFGVTVMVCATSVESSAWAGFLSFLVVFSFWSINYIAIELEMPFGDDPNDLPLHEMQTDLNKSLTSLMDPAAQTCPFFNYNPSHDSMDTTDCHLEQYLEELKPELFKPNCIRKGRSSSDWSRSGKEKVSKRMQREKEHISKRQEKHNNRKAGKEPDKPKESSPDFTSVAANESGQSDDSMFALEVKEEGTTDMQAGKTSPPTTEAAAASTVVDALLANARPSGPSSKEVTLGSQASPHGGAGKGLDYSGVDVIWLSKRLEEHLCQIARELEATRRRDTDRMGQGFFQDQI